MAVATLIARSEVRFLRRDIDLDDLQPGDLKPLSLVVSVQGFGFSVLGFAVWGLGRVQGMGFKTLRRKGSMDC